MELIVEVNSIIYDISELVTKVTWKDAMNNGCSVLEFSYINDRIVITNGSIIRFKYNKANIFYGYVFKVARSNSDEISITAYDQLRYCKAKDTIVIYGDTVTSITQRMCNYFGLATGTLAKTGYTLATSVQDDKTWLDMIYSAISDTLVNKGEWYILRDEFGSICIQDIADLKLDLILGDESLVYDFNYEQDIDSNTYNVIKIYVKGDTARDSQFVIAKDNNTVSKYGVLQYFETVDKNASQAKSKADMLLRLYNRETETLSLKCLGDTRIRAGSSFYGQIKDIKLDKRLIVKSVTHDFIPHHTMSLEVAI